MFLCVFLWGGGNEEKPNNNNNNKQTNQQTATCNNLQPPTTTTAGLHPFLKHREIYQAADGHPIHQEGSDEIRIRPGKL